MLHFEQNSIFDPTDGVGSDCRKVGYKISHIRTKLAPATFLCILTSFHEITVLVLLGLHSSVVAMDSNNNNNNNNDDNFYGAITRTKPIQGHSDVQKNAQKQKYGGALNLWAPLSRPVLNPVLMQKSLK